MVGLARGLLKQVTIATLTKMAMRHPLTMLAAGVGLMAIRSRNRSKERSAMRHMARRRP